jgi:hypothetical protein
VSSKRLLLVFSGIVALLTVAGAVSFARYARQHALNPRLAAVAPFDIFVPGLEAWRVRLAVGLTQQLDSMPPLSAVSQDVVQERWRGQSRSEIAALDLARSTSAGLAIYGRLDPMINSGDSVRVQLIGVDAGNGLVVVRTDRAWAVANLDALPRALAEQVRANYRYPK